MKEITQLSSSIASRCSVSEGDSRGGVSGGAGVGAVQRVTPSPDVQGPRFRPVTSSLPEMPPSTTVNRRPPTCCFCWCCSCTRLKTNNDCKRLQKDLPLDNVKPVEEVPTLVEVQEWSQSFEKVMSTVSGREVFREFLRSEYSEENMLFWMAVEDLRKESDPHLVEEKARLIYEDYISILSPKEVSLDSRVREEINQGMSMPTSRMYDEAQLQIYTLMKRDSYPRFLNSKTYKRLISQS